MEETEGKELYRVSLDFETLQQYQNPQRENLPIVSFIGVYEQAGIFDFIEKYYKENNIEEGSFAYMENIFAHPQTIVDIKHLVERNWGSYDITINEKGVHWKDGYNNTREKHRVKELNKTVQRAINRDFLECCPGADPSLSEGILVIRDKVIEVVEDPQDIEAQEIIEVQE